MMTLHHREEKAAIYPNEADANAAKLAATKAFRNTRFTVEPKDGGFAVKTVDGPVKRWLAKY